MGTKLLLRKNIPYDTLRANYVAQGFGGMIVWNMSTFQEAEWATGGVDVNTFAPTDLDIDQWLDACVSAGMTYVSLTTKHHDGFALWATSYAVPKYAPYSIAQTTWYTNNGSPDVVGLFVAGCRARSLNPVLYFSMIDWTYEGRTGTDEISGTAAYLEMIKLQLSELLTNYGQITAIWTDGWGWHMGYEEITYEEILAYIHSIQPNCLLVENEYDHPSTHTQIEVFESATPIGNTVPAESVMTIQAGNKWFYNTSTPYDLRTLSEIRGLITTCNSNNATLQLGLAPDKTGHLPASQVALLGQIPE